MNRKVTVSKLIKEGFSEKTLAGLNDVQLKLLSNRVLGEQQMPSAVTNVSKQDLATQNMLKQQKKPFATYEGEMKEEDTGERESAIKRIEFKLKHEKDPKKIKSMKELLKRIKKNEKDDKGIEAKSEKLGVTLNEWVDNIVGKNVHPFTSKSEIIDLIRKNIQEQEVAEPEVDVETLPEFLTFDAIKAAQPSPAEPTTKPTTRPGKPDQKPRPRTPYQPGPGINPRPKAEKK
jgi:hypothetical protein